MRKILFILLAAAGILTACSKEGQAPEQQIRTTDRICIDFGLEGMNVQTKSSNPDLDVTLSQGCTVAFYSKSENKLLATGYCKEGETKVYVTDVPTESCTVYGLANPGTPGFPETNFPWPGTVTELENLNIPVNVLSTTKAVPQSSTGTDEWTPGVNQMKINVARLYTRVSLQTQDRTEEFVVSDIHVKSCPSAVYPFGTKKCTDESGNCDYATESDLVAFNGDNPLELFIPSNGKSTLQLKAARRNGDGFDYADTYEIYVPERDVKGDTYEQKLEIGKGNDPEGKYIIIIIGTDTRSVVWGASSLDVKTDGQAYSTTVKGIAGNEGTSWKYKLTWTGKSSLEGTMIQAAGKTYPLSTSGYIEVTSIGSVIPVTFTSTSQLSADETINIIAQIPDGMSATLPVTIKKQEIDIIEIFFDNASSMVVGTSMNLAVKARHGNGTVEDITNVAEIGYDNDFFNLNESSKQITSIKKNGCLKGHNFTAQYVKDGQTYNTNTTINVTPDIDVTSKAPFADMTFRVVNKNIGKSGFEQEVGPYNETIELPVVDTDDDIAYYLIDNSHNLFNASNIEYFTVELEKADGTKVNCAYQATKYWFWNNDPDIQINDWQTLTLYYLGSKCTKVKCNIHGIEYED